MSDDYKSYYGIDINHDGKIDQKDDDIVGFCAYKAFIADTDERSTEEKLSDFITNTVAVIGAFLILALVAAVL